MEDDEVSRKKRRNARETGQDRGEGNANTVRTAKGPFVVGIHGRSSYRWCGLWPGTNGTGVPGSSPQPGGRSLEEGPSRGRLTHWQSRGRTSRPALGTFHYTLTVRSFDGAPLAATYYPSKLGSAAPAVMLIHEMGRSRKDFEDAVPRPQRARSWPSIFRAWLRRIQHGSPWARTKPARPDGMIPNK